MANSETFEASSTQRVRVEELPPKTPTPKVVPLREEAEPPPQAATAPPLAGVPDDSARTFATLRAIAMILSARALVFATMAGGFILGSVAIIWPSLERVGVLAVYGVFVIGPAIYLERRKA